MIGTAQETGQQANSVIDAVYEVYISRLVVVQYLVMPHVRYVYMLLLLIILCISHAHLGLHIGVSLKGRTTLIWSFGCGFASTTTIG